VSHKTGLGGVLGRKRPNEGSGPKEHYFPLPEVRKCGKETEKLTQRWNAWGDPSVDLTASRQGYSLERLQKSNE